MVEPLDRGSQNSSSSVGQGEFVVAGGQPALLLEVAVATLDDVTAAVGLDVQADGPAPARPAVATVFLLVTWFRDHTLDAAAAECGTDGAGGVGLVAAQHVRSVAGPTGPGPTYRQCIQQRAKHR